MLPVDDPVIEVAWPRRESRALSGVEAELAQLAAGLCDVAGRGGDGLGDASRPWPQAALARVRVHLFLTASLLLPLWRDLGPDHAAVDRDEVRIGQLRTLADRTAEGGADDPLAQARLTVLAEGLARHRQRAAVWLRALELVADPARIAALQGAWHAQRTPMLAALARGEDLALENEDADPVGVPAA